MDILTEILKIRPLDPLDAAGAGVSYVWKEGRKEGREEGRKEGRKEARIYIMIGTTNTFRKYLGLTWKIYIAFKGK